MERNLKDLREKAEKKLEEIKPLEGLHEYKERKKREDLEKELKDINEAIKTQEGNIETATKGVPGKMVGLQGLQEQENLADMYIHIIKKL
jgi:uncharacterized FlaG/YvyC family protein